MAAAARLEANDGNDPAIIDYVTHFYDQLSPGDAGYWTTLSGVAWILGKYWDEFTPAQLDHLKTKLKGLSNLTEHGTENHALNKAVGGYLYAQYWPNETGWLNGKLTSAELLSTTRNNLMKVMRSLYEKGINEDLSTTYVAVHLHPYFVLFDCTTDPQLKNAVDAALHFHVAHLAANHYEGMVIPPFNRENAPQRNTHSQGLPWIPALEWNYWLYWGEVQNRVPVGSDFIGNKENRWVMHAALSDWRPPTAIHSVAFGETVPYELTSTKKMGGDWGAGTPGEYERHVYRDKLYAMGSGNMQFRPDGYHLDYNMFGLFYESDDAFNYVDCHHHYWRSNERIWRGASPFVQMAQHEGTAIVLFNIPTKDPWFDRGEYLSYRSNHFDDLIQEALVRYPKSIDQKEEANGWIFLREGDVYVAIRPLKAYSIDGNYSTQMTKYPSGTSDAYMNYFVDAVAQFNVVRSAFPQTGFVFDVATKDDFATFDDFQAAVNSKQVTVDWNALSVSYTSLKGDTLTSAWNAPDYNVPNFSRVWVRPTFTVNGTTVAIDDDFVNGEAVIKSSSVELIDRMLRLTTPAGDLTVDWSQQDPVF